MSKLLKKTLSPKAPAKRKRSRVVSMDTAEPGTEKRPLGRPLPLGVGADTTKHRTVPASSRSSAENVSSPSLRCGEGSEGQGLGWLPYYDTDTPLTCPEPDRYPNTDDELISYLVSLPDAGPVLKGNIRTKETCPICHRPFKVFPRAGIICKRHKTIPRRFFIDLWLKGKRSKIYCDRKGEPLDSYSKALRVLQSINADMASEIKKFKADDYKATAGEGYYLRALFDLYKSGQKGYKYRQQINYAEHYIFSHFAESQDIRELEQADIASWVESLEQYSKKSHLGGKAKKNIVCVLLAVHNQARKKGLLSARLVMPDIKLDKRPKVIPSISDSCKIISAINVAEEERLIYLFLLAHPCRLSEARAVQAGDFDFVRNTVTICRSLEGIKGKAENKTGNPYIIPVHGALIDRLRALCIKREPTETVFHFKGHPWKDGKLRERWNDACKRTGLKYQLYKGTKYACLSELATQGGDIRNAQKMAGHTSPKMTEEYAQRVDIEKLRSIQSLIVFPSGS